MKWFWLSFADASRPVGSQFLGAIVAPGFPGKLDDDPFIAAVKLCHVLSINPGGEVLSREIDDEALLHIKASDVLRLLSREECERFDAELIAARGMAKGNA